MENNQKKVFSKFSKALASGWLAKRLAVQGSSKSFKPFVLFASFSQRSKYRKQHTVHTESCIEAVTHIIMSQK